MTWPKDEMGRTDLHYAVVDGPIDVVQELLRAGANVDAADDQGFTPLHFAGQRNRVDAVDALLDAGASVDPVDQWGNTPLFRAVFNAGGDPVVVHRLVRSGADPNHPNHQGVSPRQLADRIANQDTSGYFPPPDATA